MKHTLFLLFVVPFLCTAQTLFYDPTNQAPIEEEYEEDTYYDDGSVCEEFDESDYFWYAEPYDCDVDEMWYWEDEAVYPTRRDNSWVDELTKPW
jgi:hypothetical protein